MKTIIAILFTVVILAVPTAAFADGSVQFISQPDQSTVPSGELFVSKTFDNGLGASAFCLVTKGWAQLYAGPTWAPAQWLELGLSAGLEQTTNSELGLRFGSSVWAEYKSFSFLGLAEFNPQSFRGDDSGVWFDLTPKYQANQWLTIGVKYRRPVGAGPILEVSPTTSTTIWANWAPIDPEKADGDIIHVSRFLIGLKFKL